MDRFLAKPKQKRHTYSEHTVNIQQAHSDHMEWTDIMHGECTVARQGVPKEPPTWQTGVPCPRNQKLSLQTKLSQDYHLISH